MQNRVQINEGVSFEFPRVGSFLVIFKKKSKLQKNEVQIGFRKQVFNSTSLKVLSKPEFSDLLSFQR